MIIAVEYAFVPEHDERRLAARPAHREWLTALKAEGRLVQAGPFADGLSSMLVFDVADEAAVQALLAEDPYPKESVVPTVRVWTTLFDFGR